MAGQLILYEEFLVSIPAETLFSFFIAGDSCDRQLQQR